MALDQTPDRLRGQHCRIGYNIELNTYTIKDMGEGLGTFLKCDNKYQKTSEFRTDSSTQLTDNCVLQIGTSLYALVNIITRAQYNQFKKID